MTRLEELKENERLALLRVKAAYDDFYRQEMDPIQAQIDRAVYEAFGDEGLTKSEISRQLGESRVTVNARLAREAERSADPIDIVGRPGRPAAPEKPVEKVKQKAPEKVWPYAFADADYLSVCYEDYGPDHLSGTAEYEIIPEEDGDPWFLADRAADNNTDINAVLDTNYTSWYYKDAVQFVNEHQYD